MSYLKFNCHDLASQNSEIHRMYRKTQQLSDELANIIGKLDPQIRSYEGLHQQLAASRESLGNIVERFLSSYTALDQITDIYYAAENKALQETERLLGSISVNESTTAPNAFPAASSSFINNNDLIVEEWLAELVYSSSRDADKR